MSSAVRLRKGAACRISDRRAKRWSHGSSKETARRRTPSAAPRSTTQSLAEPLRTLIDKVAKHAYKVTDEDIAGVRASGLSEDQIFEIVVCAAIGQATRQYDTALAALEAVTGKE